MVSYHLPEIAAGMCQNGIVNLFVKWKSLQKRRTRERKEAEEGE